MEELLLPSLRLLDGSELSVCIRMIEGGEGERQALRDAFQKALSEKEALLSLLEDLEKRKTSSKNDEREDEREVINWKQRYYEKY